MRRLLIRPGAIGDLVLSLPALENLRSDYTEVWVARQNVPLIRFADRVRAIADTGLDMLEIRGPAPKLLKTLQSFDEMVCWYGAGRAEFRDAVGGLQLPFRFLNALPRDHVGHATDFYLGQIGLPLGAIPRLPLPAAERTFAVIHPFSGGRTKNWPIECFRAVAAALEKLMPVCWSAGPEEELPDATRFDDLYVLACWLGRARVYVGNDSGPTHLAAAAGTPVVAIFGPTDPRVWAPRGPNVSVVQPPHSDGRVESISVNSVLAALEKSLPNGNFLQQS